MSNAGLQARALLEQRARAIILRVAGFVELYERPETTGSLVGGGSKKKGGKSEGRERGKATTGKSAIRKKKQDHPETDPPISPKSGDKRKSVSTRHEKTSNDDTTSMDLMPPPAKRARDEKQGAAINKAALTKEGAVNASLAPGPKGGARRDDALQRANTSKGFACGDGSISECSPSSLVFAKAPTLPLGTKTSTDGHEEAQAHAPFVGLRISTLQSESLDRALRRFIARLSHNHGAQNCVEELASFVRRFAATPVRRFVERPTLPVSGAGSRPSLDSLFDPQPANGQKRVPGERMISPESQRAGVSPFEKATSGNAAPEQMSDKKTPSGDTTQLLLVDSRERTASHQADPLRGSAIPSETLFPRAEEVVSAAIRFCEDPPFAQMLAAFGRLPNHPYLLVFDPYAFHSLPSPIESPHTTVPQQSTTSQSTERIPPPSQPGRNRPDNENSSPIDFGGRSSDAPVASRSQMIDYNVLEIPGASVRYPRPDAPLRPLCALSSENSSGSEPNLQPETELDEQERMLTEIFNEEYRMTGVRCSNCKEGRYLNIWNVQARSADEGSSTYFHCLRCNNFDRAR